MKSADQEKKTRQGKESRRYSTKDYELVISLRNQGMSYNKIAQRVSISSATAQMWVKTERFPRCIYALKLQNHIRKESRQLSEDLSYIYGVLIGDGYLENNPKSSRITLQVTDKEFANHFYSTLNRWSGLTPTMRESDVEFNHVTKYGVRINCRTHYFIVRLASKQAVRLISQRIRCRTKDWGVPDEIGRTKNLEYVKSFLKGIFDSEGYPIFNYKYRVRRIELEMYGKGVNQLQELLKKIKIESTVTQPKKQRIKGTYILRILRNESIINFAKSINFTIIRKRKKLNDIIRFLNGIKSKVR